MIKGGQNVELARTNGAKGGRPSRQAQPKQYLDRGEVKTEYVTDTVQECACGYQTNVVGDLARHRKATGCGATF